MAAASKHEATLAVMARELLELEAYAAEDGAAGARERERLAAETRHLQRKLSRVTKESEQKIEAEREKLEKQMAESARRSEAKLRAERTRMAVRYGNSGSRLASPKAGELGSTAPTEPETSAPAAATGLHSGRLAEND